MSHALPTSKAFYRRVLGLANLYSFPALAIILGCLFSLLDLTGAQWRYLLGCAVLYTVVFGPLQALHQRRSVRPVMLYLDRRAAGEEPSPEELRAAFHNVMRMPKDTAVSAFFGWFVPVSLATIVMELRWTQWGFFESFAVILSGSMAGIVSAILQQFSVKPLIEPVRTALALDLPDVQERARLIVSNTMREKLVWCVTFISAIPVVFAVLLFQKQSVRTVERFVVEIEDDVLDHVANGESPQDALARLTAAAPQIGSALRLERFDARSGRLEPDVAEEVQRTVLAGGDRGDGVGLPSSYHFAWRRDPAGQVWLASLRADALTRDDTRLWGIFAALLLVSAGVALGFAYLLSNDVSRATERLRREAARLASGDLRRGEVFESEDELGELSRAFESMASSLRETVGRVSGAADRVEATALEMASVSSSVSSVTADQVAGIRQTTQAMEGINEQVRGIAESAQGLNVSVEESSSSILELGAAGEELNETASVMSGKVNEVSSSIEQMVRSVKQVLENTESLSEAAVDTSASMGEMATSMREVDTSAEETAHLSRQVVEAADSGQAKMVQTIEGMNAIREATETAERVIRSLGSRASEIGAIVDVIDDVADETNLLALNAAIIAAQAGEHGRAFSVVADEIKDLADRVLASTKEIGSLIRAVQEESTNAIGAIERGTQSVAEGVDLTAEAGASLEDITRASRESGQRIAGIVSAVREQAKAARHVVDLMERVRGGVDQIRQAAAEQDRGNEVVYRGSVAMRDVAAQVRGTTEEQARGSGRIRESVEGVREAVEQINAALQEQSASCRSAVEFLEAIHARTRSNEDSAQRLDQVVRDLARQAESLRDDIGRFQIA